MREGRGKGRENGEGIKRGKWECTKNSPKTQKIWHLGMPIGATTMSYIFGTFLSGTTFLLQIVCFYLVPFESNRASNSTILKKVPTEFQHI